MIHGEGKVHCADAGGSMVYNRLLDTGEETVRFESGFGSLTRSQIKANHWSLDAGWFDDAEMESHRREKYPHLCRPEFI